MATRTQPELYRLDRWVRGSRERKCQAAAHVIPAKVHPSSPPNPEQPRTAQTMPPMDANMRQGRNSSWMRTARRSPQLTFLPILSCMTPLHLCPRSTPNSLHSARISSLEKNPTCLKSSFPSGSRGSSHPTMTMIHSEAPSPSWAARNTATGPGLLTHESTRRDWCSSKHHPPQCPLHRPVHRTSDS